MSKDNNKAEEIPSVDRDDLEIKLFSDASLYAMEKMIEKWKKEKKSFKANWLEDE